MYNAISFRFRHRPKMECTHTVLNLFNPFRFDSTCRLIVRVRLDPYRECFANDVRRWYRMILQFAIRSFHNNSLVV